MDNNPPSNPTSPPRVQVKKENEEEIKEFAETAMNELLGWYGYERLELRRWAASRARDASSPEKANEHKNKDECSWCNKSIASDSGALQQAGAAFCSELCFSQSRRANFKRAKTCDWCRHVRHTVAYVDFQDGATQLQFCSDKCLNQYKMHIFCRETQAHLDLNPHLASSGSTSSLITPELWLKNCKSRSTSPTSERSSPNPETSKTDKTDPPKTQKSPLPLITIAPTAKLMRQKREDTVQKSPEAKDNRTKMNLRKRRTSKSSPTVTRQRNSTPKAQDLRICSPSEASSPHSIAVQSPPQPNPPPPPPFNPMFNMPPPFMNHEMRHTMPGNMFPPRMPFLPPRMPMQERPRPPPPLNFPQPLGQPPPVTVLVPYPVMIPLPIPIPIPIPLSAFLQAHSATKVKTEARADDTEGPLDFTMNHRRDEDSTEPVAPETSEMEQESEINDRVDDENDSETRNPEQTLPKFKITRLGNKMAKIVAKTKEQSESSRPLRKRRRLVEAGDDEALIPKTRKIVQV